MLTTLESPNSPFPSTDDCLYYSLYSFPAKNIWLPIKFTAAIGGCYNPKTTLHRHTLPPFHLPLCLIINTHFLYRFLSKNNPSTHFILQFLTRTIERERERERERRRFHRLFPRTSYSSHAASYNSFTVSSLINSCGFPLDKAISASKCLNIQTPDRADSVIAFFKNQGFTETQISHLVRNFPRALTCNPQTNLFPKFEFLRSVGLSDSDIVKILIARPKSLRKSLKNSIEPTFNLLRDLLQSNEKTLLAIRRCAWVVDLDSQANMISNMQLLCDVGVPGSKMLYVLTDHPRDISDTKEQFKKAMEEVVEMGIDPLKTNFMSVVHALRSISKSTWEKKMDNFLLPVDD